MCAQCYCINEFVCGFMLSSCLCLVSTYHSSIMPDYCRKSILEYRNEILIGLWNRIQ